MSIGESDWQQVLNLIVSMGFHIDRHDPSTGRLEIRIPQVRPANPDSEGKQET